MQGSFTILGLAVVFKVENKEKSNLLAANVGGGNIL
jgi:hypothetical protein